MSPGALNINFSALNIVQRPQHHYLVKLWHKNDVLDEKKVCGGPKPCQILPRNSQADMAQKVLVMYDAACYCI